MDIYNVVNDGKGVIFFPPDSNNHPIVGAAYSPRKPGVFCPAITVNGNDTRPSWAITAEQNDISNGAVDQTTDPSTHTSGYLTDFPAWGGYALRSEGKVCPLHFSQGIMRNGGVAYFDKFTYTPQLYTSTHTYHTSEGNIVTFQFSATVTNLLQGGKRPIQVAGPLLWRSNYHSATILTVTANTITAQLNFTPSEGDGITATMFVADVNETSLITGSNRKEAVDVDRRSTTTSRVSFNKSSTDITEFGNNRIIVGYDYKNNTSGQYRGASIKFRDPRTTATTTVVDTDSGFLVPTNKGLSITGELRRNFLRISPSVFAHKGWW